MNDNTVLEHLRHIREQVDRMADDMREIKQRAGSLERKVADLHGDFASVSTRLDSLDGRVNRIEARLELH